MNRNRLKSYAPEARREFIQAVTDRAALYGLTAKTIEPMTEEGDVAIIAGRAFPKKVAEKRKKLEARIGKLGFEQTIEAMAYTWFNRLVAIRYMELHGYLEHGYRVLSAVGSGQWAVGSDKKNTADRRLPAAYSLPEIVEHAEHVDLPGLDREKVIELKLDGTKEEELYRMLLIAQCNALHRAMPFLFESIDDETELLLPDHLLHSDSLVRKLAGEIPEEDWQEVEIIGWLYQFYISEKKDEVIGKVVKSEDIPAATQLFTPNWIVKYLVQNSLGRQWMATYPNSPLKGQMEFYIEPAEQRPEVQAHLDKITPATLNPEELTLLDPACGSGHILVEAYSLLAMIYQERSYRAKDIPRLILEKNLYGLEIDDRAAQLAAFALMMKARGDDRRIFEAGAQPHVLSIQETRGLNALTLTEDLNAPLRDSLATASSNAVEQQNLAALIELFANGKSLGSLIRIPQHVAAQLHAIRQRTEAVLAAGDMHAQAAANILLPIIEQADTLAAKYSCVLLNPPYLGKKGMNTTINSFAKRHFPQSKSDTFAMFMERVPELTRTAGYTGLVTPFVWMFLSSHESLRQSVFYNKSITTLVKPSYTSFFESAIVSLVTFVVQQDVESIKGTYFDFGYIGSAELQPAKLLEGIENPDCGYRYDAVPDDFREIPGSPVAFWLSDRVRRAFGTGTPLAEIAQPKVGMRTGNNEKFLRRWFEVPFGKVGVGFENAGQVVEAGMKWIPFSKGGEFRKWYGNMEWVVNWEDNGDAIKRATLEKYPHLKGNLGWKISNEPLYFQRTITWSAISSSYFGVRFLDAGSIFGTGGSCIFPTDNQYYLIGAFLCSNLCFYFLRLGSPSLNINIEDVAQLPFLDNDLLADRAGRIEEIAKECLQIARNDWNSVETSWDFQVLPILSSDIKRGTLEASCLEWSRQCNSHITRMQGLEEENNRLFIDTYGLHDEFTDTVPEDQISLDRYDREKDIQRLISYSIGCMMGRYSLDKPGLIYADTGNNGFDSSQYSTFPADEDGITPVTDTAWFDDAAANRLVQFISVAWPQEHLQENLKFIADSLGPKRGESPRETIRRYLAQQFFKNHLQAYRGMRSPPRPIYWLFSSGKQRGFQSLVYLHRYNEGTLSRMRTQYVIPLLGKMAARIDHLSNDIASATSSQHRKRLEKEKDTVTKQLAEVQEYDEPLRHYADRRIKLDLDDGVKVNYGKFGDLLAEVKAVTGEKPKVEVQS